MEQQHCAIELEYVWVVVGVTISISEDDSNSELDTCRDDLNIIELGTAVKEHTSEVCEDNNGDDLNFDSGIDDSDLQKQS